MILNPVVANLHNTKTNRYHPILFRESPLPSASTGSSLMRHKSIGHHTDGFDTRDEALSYCEKMARDLETEAGGVRLCLDRDFAWDGEDVPAMVVFFGEQDGKTVPLMGG
jgi:hypothetical protein